MLHYLSKAGVLVALLAAVFATGAVAGPSAQVFDAVPEPEKIDAQWRAHVCALLAQRCDRESLRLLGTSAPGLYMVTAGEPLAMAHARFDAASGWKLDTIRDFSGYRHSAAAGEGQKNARLSLAPALYPLAEGKWAAAVLLSLSESYSGGGAGFTTADFVPVEIDDAANAIVKIVPAHRGIPFSCSKTVRACFSETEYKRSPHCHEENEGSLRIRYGQPLKPGQPYRWSFQWSETEWAAHKPQRAAKTSRKSFASSEEAGAGISFCGGPAS